MLPLISSWRASVVLIIHLIFLFVFCFWFLKFLLCSRPQTRPFSIRTAASTWWWQQKASESSLRQTVKIISSFALHTRQCITECVSKVFSGLFQHFSSLSLLWLHGQNNQVEFDSSATLVRSEEIQTVLSLWRLWEKIMMQRERVLVYLL